MGQGSTPSTARQNDATRATPSAAPPPLPVSRLRPAYQQVADQLRELILNGSLASGHRLPPEADLGGNFGVSRSTVREALRVLASQGLVRTVRGTTGGTFIAHVEPDQVSDYLETSIGLMSGSDTLTLADILEAREMLEVRAAGLAARRREPRHVDALRAAMEREKHSRGRSVRFNEHRHFHGIIIEATGNGLLTVMTEPVFRVLQSRFLSPDVPREFWAQVDREHETIVDRIDAGDAEGAGEAMQVHLSRIRDAYHD
ncbi:FadR/GntR family transcriptional regulator [Streptosporangium amethystogenes]|uniref:FadR/GntR family transcriptional regulator n=1 Tax=Streptosporangium amethystogenes TaxID=2002 RepID=UPI0036146335